MWLRPSGYVIGALLAGTVSVAGLQHTPAVIMPLVVLWVIFDICLGTALWELRLMARPSGAGRSQVAVRPPLQRHVSSVFLCLLAGAGLLWIMPRLVQQVALGSLAVGAMLVLLSSRLPVRAALALRIGLQVTAAWLAAYLLQAPSPSPLALLGLIAGLGTGARLWHAVRPAGLSLWLVRVCWATLFAVVVLARQPLLGGIVALTGIADDLYRLQPWRQENPGWLAAVSWVGAWLLVSLAATYWGMPI
jgi:hypothetical protein